MSVRNRILDRFVRAELTDDALQELQERIGHSPVVPKYDPEDQDPAVMTEEEEEQKVDEMTEIIGHPLVEVVQIGGSYDVTAENIDKTLEMLGRAQEREEEIYTMLEPGSTSDLKRDGEFDFDILTQPDAINKPYVWNTDDSEWKDGKHSEAQHLLNELAEDRGHEAIGSTVASKLRSVLPGYLDGVIPVDSIAREYAENVEADSYIKAGFDSRMIPETYLVVNPDAAVAEKTGADRWIEEHTDDELVDEAAALTADRVQDGYDGIIYIEASGELGPEEAVEAADRRRESISNDNSMIVAYGGGIYGSDDIERYLEAGADMVFVGNSVQEQGADALPDEERVEEILR